MHCADPGCLKACPAPGAIVQYTNGIVDFIHENCIGCGYCVSGCPFNIPRISKTAHVSKKCTLCSDRVAVGQGPACAKACPTQCISFGTKADMIAHAEERITDLKERGYENARLNQLSNVDFYAQDLTADFSQQEWAKQGFDKILLDPARAGAPGVMAHIIKLAPKRVVYVSCNPATLARDSEALISAGYQIQRLAMLDMFPHTGHLESMVLFEHI